MRSLNEAVAAAKAAAPAYAANDMVKVNVVPSALQASRPAPTQHGHMHNSHGSGSNKSASVAHRPSFGLPAQTLIVLFIALTLNQRE